MMARGESPKSKPDRLAQTAPTLLSDPTFNATTARRSKGGQFVTHVAALPGNPYDGHTLATVIPAMENTIGNTIERLLADARLPRPQCAARL